MSIFALYVIRQAEFNKNYVKSYPVKKKFRSFIFIYILIWQAGIFEMVASPLCDKPGKIIQSANEGSISINANTPTIIINQFSEAERIIHLLTFRFNYSFTASGFDFQNNFRNRETDIPIVKKCIINLCEGVQITIPRSPPPATV